MRAAGDWLQGPYVYALYQHYGFDRGDIGRLFIAGFGSSMVFGTIVGSLADKTYALAGCPKPYQALNPYPARCRFRLRHSVSQRFWLPDKQYMPYADSYKP